jgi:cytochrome c553
MALEHETFNPHNPWPKIAWSLTAGVIAIAAVIGFGLLDRYQQDGPTLDLWNAICRGLGITADTSPAGAPQPPLRTPTLIAWNASTLDQIAAGHAGDGAVIAMVCTACHGPGGVSSSDLSPTLAGMDAAVIYKQLNDFRSDKRLSDIMGAIAKTLSTQDSADVGAYFAAQPNGLPKVDNDRVPESGRSLREAAPGKRLVFAGDPHRGIPPCSACHGPGGYKLGAPALQGQHASYIEGQLAAFAEGTRANDIFEQMRGIAGQLTPDEMHALAAFYAAPENVSGSESTRP